eukprot:10804-Heterococcus_DN1.PRE.1
MAPKSAAVRALEREVEQLKRQLLEQGLVIKKFAQQAHALDKDEILDNIFAFTGVNEYLYVSGVCRRWRGRYISFCCKARCNLDATKTLHSTTFATVARFELALDCGLRLRSEAADFEADVPFFNDLPKLSSDARGILTVARVRGAAWHTTMSEDAAFYGEFELLKWLRRSGCGWSPLLVGCNIIRSPRSSAKCLSTMK